MPLVVGGVIMSFSLEDMPKVAAAVGATNLCAAHAERVVLNPLHRSRDGVKEGRPSAERCELGVGSVQRRVAPGALVDTGHLMPVVLTGMRSLGALLAQNPELFCTKDTESAYQFVSRC